MFSVQAAKLTLGNDKYVKKEQLVFDKESLSQLIPFVEYADHDSLLPRAATTDSNVTVSLVDLTIESKLIECGILRQEKLTNSCRSAIWSVWFG